jgi:hypothetical protein
MGVNATTFVPAYVAGEVLTAADLTVTNSGVPVFADTTARDAAFGGTGEKVLAEGQLAYLEDSDVVQYYDGSVWASVGVSPGLVLLNTTTISAAATTNVNSVFSATYQNYLINFTLSAATGGNVDLTFRLRASAADATTNYSNERIVGFNGTVGEQRNSAGTDEWPLAQTNNTAQGAFQMTIFNPFDAAPTKQFSQLMSTGAANGFQLDLVAGYNSNATSYDGFSILSGGTISGTLRIYGLRNS